MPSPFERFSPPPDGARDRPEIALQWILENVPCFINGRTPIAWTHAVFREAARWNIRFSIIEAALLMARKRGYEFAGVVTPPSFEERDTHQHLKAAPDPRQTAVATARWLESKYQAASLSGNPKEMESLAKAFAELLNKAEAEHLPEEEIQHGAPLLRRAIVRRHGAPEGGRGGDPSGGGPYRVQPVTPVRPPPRRGR